MRREIEPLKRLGYRIEEWCVVTNSSRAKAYKDMADGRLPYVIIGGRRFIPQSAVEELLSSSTAP